VISISSEPFSIRIPRAAAIWESFMRGQQMIVTDGKPV
jgi:hypothetical protein